MRPLYKFLLVGCLCFVAGTAVGGWVCLHPGTLGLGRLDERLDVPVAPMVVRFDVWSTPDETPAPPVFKTGLAVLPHEGESMVVHLAGESFVNLIVCTPHGAVNPCGPDGVRPDAYGAVVLDDHLSGAKTPKPLP